MGKWTHEKLIHAHERAVRIYVCTRIKNPGKYEQLHDKRLIWYSVPDVIYFSNISDVRHRKT